MLHLWSRTGILVGSTAAIQAYDVKCIESDSHSAIYTILMMDTISAVVNLKQFSPMYSSIYVDTIWPGSWFAMVILGCSSLVEDENYLHDYGLHNHPVVCHCQIPSLYQYYCNITIYLVCKLTSTYLCTGEWQYTALLGVKWYNAKFIILVSTIFISTLS